MTKMNDCWLGAIYSRLHTRRPYLACPCLTALLVLAARVTATCALIALAVTDAMAQAPTDLSRYRPPMVILQNDITYDVSDGGTFVMEQVKRIRIDSGQGVRDNSQISFSFSPSLQDLEVIEAYTTQRNGKKIDVSSEGILTQQSPQSANAPMFDDAKVRTIIFPAVEVGSVLTFHLRRRQKTPLFPGAHSTFGVFPSVESIQSAQITLRASESYPLYIEASGLNGGEVKPDRPGMRKWNWTLQNLESNAPEVGSVSAMDFSPRLAVTSFPNYDAAAQAYLKRARPKAFVTPAVQKLADEITDGITDKRLQAEEIYYWVSVRIRYVAIFFDFGGVVPHMADAILAAKYGDCKDHVTILEALLAAKGIRSSPVLVNNSNSYLRLNVAAIPGVFNHAITYLPDWELFLDSTAAVAPFGVLASPLPGKPALITDDGTGKSRLVTLPMTNPVADQVRVETEFVVGADGTIKGTSKIQNKGVFDIVSRSVFSRVQRGTESQVAERVLNATKQTGSGRYIVGRPSDFTREFKIDTEVTLPSYVILPGPGAFMIPQGVVPLSNISDMFSIASVEKRNFPIAVLGGYFEEITKLRLPDNIAPKFLPKPTTYTGAFGNYESHYSLEANTLLVRRVLNLTLAKPVIAPELYPDFREMARAISRDLRTQIVYE